MTRGSVPGGAGLSVLSGLAGVLLTGITLTGNGGLDVAGLESSGRGRLTQYDSSFRGAFAAAGH
ncbi:hypothetical protein QK292_07535 [Arthrobacter sp. AL08]|uniref:hypothetical protein n=1 Tax=Micrococcaceae TaxID=1268 RepID=UPI00249A4B93|nr:MULTISPECIES: hypothetical protein [Micrococcaceae]MDI3241317.1 hypothetical protein [Arthrobacter sp. AL05]MDI3277426.1 hypothetical protein [Arthrobacter sp. AL08]MDJ0354088.1 hypothetical protein [Pseudarthrobacter sp. PH31-O2]